jgi:hypothetical protein
MCVWHAWYLAVHRFQHSAFYLRASEGGGKGSQQQHDQVVRYSDRYRLQQHGNRYVNPSTPRADYRDGNRTYSLSGRLTSEDLNALRGPLLFCSSGSKAQQENQALMDEIIHIPESKVRNNV